MFLLDTNVVSESRRGRHCNPGVAAWFASVVVTDLFISALTIGEIRKGITLVASRGDHTQAANLDTWLHGILTIFAERILPVDANVADVWGRMYATRNVPVIDGLLAATAIVHDLTLVTRNISHAQGLGANLLNPFAA